MESKNRLNMESDSFLRDAMKSTDKVLNVNADVPVVAETFLLLALVKRANEIVERTGKTIRLFSRNTPLGVEKILLGLLQPYDKIYYTNEVDECQKP